MTTEIKHYEEIRRARSSMNATNSGLRMAGKADQQKPLPELPKKPVKYLLEYPDGGYAGTSWDEEEAYEQAEEHGLTLTVLPYDKV